MTRGAAVIAYAAVSPAGRGYDALGLAVPGQAAGVFTGLSESMKQEGFRRPRAGRIDPGLLADAPAADRAERLLLGVLDELVAKLDLMFADWRCRRVGVILGTSSGSMPALVEVLGRRARRELVEASLARQVSYAAALALVRSRLGIPLSPCLEVLGACASSTIAVGLGAEALSLGRCDLVIAGGFDAYTPFVAAGFEALAATSESQCLSFRVARDGMIVSEGAGLVALVRSDSSPMSGPHIVGFGATSDAHHTTAPEPHGRGLCKAARQALHEAGAPAVSVGMVSAHATATLYNDQAEARALAELLGNDGDWVVQASKASLGHTLGAAGILEILALVEAMRRGWLPATAGHGPVLPELQGRLLGRTELGRVHTALKLAAAFGGLNAALVLGATASPDAFVPTRVRCVAVGRRVEGLDVKMALPHCVNPGRLERVEPGAAMVLGAIVELMTNSPYLPPRHTAVVVGTEVGSIEANERFDRRRREGGPRLAEPRRFPATTPNLAAAEASIALGLTGPSFAVTSDEGCALEAMVCGFDLVQTGQSDACLVVVAEEVGETVEGLWTAAGWEVPPNGARAALFVPAAEGPPLDRPNWLRHLQSRPNARTTTEEWWHGLCECGGA